MRTATNGDVRLSNTPEQWDPQARLVERKVDTASARLVATLAYPDYDFHYRVEAEPSGDGVLISVHLDQPLPQALVGLAGLNMEFLPSAYFGRTYLADDRARPNPVPRARCPWRPLPRSPARRAPSCCGLLPPPLRRCSL